MKKILNTLVITCIIIAFMPLSIVFAEYNTTQAYTSNKDVLAEHLNIVEKYKDGISLLSKNALHDMCNNSDRNAEHLKDINYLNQQISSRSKAISSQCKIYTTSDPTLTDLLTLDIILYEYRLALVHLYQYLTIENIDYQYKSKQSFFSITTDANRKLSILKESIK